MPSSASLDVFYRYKIQNKLSDSETIREYFYTLDAKRNGYLENSEFRKFLTGLFSNKNKPYPLSNNEVEKIFNIFCEKKNQKLYLNDFNNLWLKFVIPTVRPRTALVIVDVQNDFIDGTMAISKCPSGQDGSEVIPCINELIRSVPFDAIVYTYDWHPEDHCSFIENVHKRKLAPNSPTRKNVQVNDIVIFENYPDIEQKLWPAHCIQGSYGSELHPDLILIDEKSDPFRRSVIKTYKGVKSDIDSYSAFFDNCKLNETNLNSDLKKLGINELYVCGLAGDVCVAATCNDALDLGYRVVFIEDGCRGIIVEDIERQKMKLSNRNSVIARSNQVSNMVTGRDRRPELAFITLNLKN
ncbi:Pyrazinamidase nicotinamidase [Brachionus plicatilis]|uniref:nicotinamidase n=1 Tax=Brachionus plicatilis TaxID=10195 RepID=A0A3M7SAV6_BRAPC|nr:Pyrazinamidase nicotinamidase [Brachionus plicatilis]